jgi:hypothetical protein
VCKANSAYVSMNVRLHSKSVCVRPRAVWAARILFASLAGLGLATCSCANPHATLQFSAPSSSISGIPFTVTVTAVVGGSRDTLINSRMQFKSSDPASILPSAYYFTSADAGSHSFTNGFTLMTPGNQTISAYIFDATGINGTTTVHVYAASP